MSCRLPGGVSSVDDFWKLLASGTDAVGEVPPQRWQDYQGRGASSDGLLRRTIRQGGFLDDVQGFDAEFFGISPREARLMDPQQRILLEVAWEALEHAGRAPGTLAGTDTGVFVGAWSDDYGRRLLEDLPAIDAWTGVGATLGSCAARLSHHLDLRGPSVLVDTACSSSLVAVHQACQSLRLGESGLAVAAGVNLLLSPGLTVNFERAGALSPHGRCRAFDADADGYVRSEGCAVVVLKRLTDALADGDRILGLVRGSAVTQNGHGAGIMAPSSAAQARTIRLACEAAGVSPASLDYIEAHGTGTPAGDPAEAAGIGIAVGGGRPAGDALPIGSVKTNIGHTESAAGVISLVKVVLALGHGVIPAALHHRTPHPAIAWDELGLRVVTECEPWPVHEGPRLAGVSSYGFGGTNAHVVLEGAPPTEEPSPVPIPVPNHRVVAFPWSASTEQARVDAAGGLVDWLMGAGASADHNGLAHTLTARRSPSLCRAVAVAGDREELLRALRAHTAGEADPGLVCGRVPAGAASGSVWVFSGHGSQWTGMARELLDEEPVFAAVIDELEPIFRREAQFSLRAFLSDRDLDEAGVHEIQPVIYAVQTALAQLWHDHGVRPAAVIGHSVGEIAAAVAAGGLTRTDGARLVCRRSALLRRVAGRGAMALVALPADEVYRQLASAPALSVAVAIRASPLSTVIAGTPDAVERATAHWTEQGALVRRVASDVAFHSPQMDPLLADLVAAVADIPWREPRLPVLSTSTADPEGEHVFDGAYWAGNLRNEVRLDAAVRAAAARGHRVFLEVSAHPVVVHSVRETLSLEGIEDACVTGTLRRAVPARTAFLKSAAELHCHGVPVDFGRGRDSGPWTDAPTTTWDHQRHWAHSRPVVGSAASHDPGSGTLLGSALPSGEHVPLRTWYTRLDADSVPGTAMGPAGESPVAPAVVVATVLAAAQSAPAAALRLRELEVRLPLPVDKPRDVHVVAGPQSVTVVSTEAGGSEPAVVHAVARIDDEAPPEAVGPVASVDRAPRAGEWTPGRPTESPAGDAVFAWHVEAHRFADGGLEAEVEVAADAADGEGSSAGWAAWIDAATHVASWLPGAAASVAAVESVAELTIA
ncbi:type I polyketide synthase, partial [Streptomyces sp. SID3343]|uniref:type I polyketide synthase n=1 Tax=Streptomyces sp. SID3343 TaxID=2690260 RepID=UPI00136B543E